VHKNGVNGNVLSAYEKEGKFPVVYDRDRLKGLVLDVIEGNFVLNEVPLRHSDETGEVLMELLNSL